MLVHDHGSCLWLSICPVSLDSFPARGPSAPGRETGGDVFAHHPTLLCSAVYSWFCLTLRGGTFVNVAIGKCTQRSFLTSTAKLLVWCLTKGYKGRIQS